MPDLHDRFEQVVKVGDFVAIHPDLGRYGGGGTDLAIITSIQTSSSEDSDNRVYMILLFKGIVHHERFSVLSHSIVRVPRSAIPLRAISPKNPKWEQLEALGIGVYLGIS